MVIFIRFISKSDLKTKKDINRMIIDTVTFPNSIKYLVDVTNILESNEIS